MCGGVGGSSWRRGCGCTHLRKLNLTFGYFPQLLLHWIFSFLRKDLSLNLNITISTILADQEPWNPLGFASYFWGLQVCAYMPGFYIDTGNLNSNSQGSSWWVLYLFLQLQCSFKSGHQLLHVCFFRWLVIIQYSVQFWAIKHIYKALTLKHVQALTNISGSGSTHRS